MRTIDDPDRRVTERSDNLEDKAVLEKLGRFAAYTTPKMKELLAYGQDRLGINGAAKSL